MNITEAIGKEISTEVSEFLKKTPEIQIYANHMTNTYQWRDGRFEKYCNVWYNENYECRGDMKTALVQYLKNDLKK